MVGFTISMYALVASNYMPLTGNKVRKKTPVKDKGWFEQWDMY